MVRWNCCLTDSMDQIPVQNALLVHYRNVFPTVLMTLYLGLVFFIDSLYIPTCADLITHASLCLLLASSSQQGSVYWCQNV